MADLQPFRFDAGNVDITLQPPSNAEDVALALAENKPFPEKEISLGKVSAKASKDFKINKVKFGVNAGAFAGLGVYQSGSKLLKALKADGLDEPLITDAFFPSDNTKNFIAMAWGYGVDASVSSSKIGAVGLSKGIEFGVKAGADKLFAVVRQLGKTTGARDTVGAVLSSWTTPTKIATPDDIAAGTWLITETNASLKFDLGVQYGYNFNWVKEDVRIGNLSGDVALKIDMGIKAAFGFSASGRYALVLSRDSDKKEIRLRVYKLRQQGWTFTFDASVGAKLDVPNTLAPKNLENFIRGVINLNGNQAIQDIVDGFDEWSGGTSLEKILGEGLIDAAKDLAVKLGFDPQTEVDKVIKRLRDIIKIWRSLPQRITSVLYTILREQFPQIETLKTFLKRLIELTNTNALVKEITDQIERIDFFDSAVGKWLLAASRRGLVSLVDNFDEEKAQLKEWAEKTLDLLDGDLLEDSLSKLINWIEERLHLDKIFDFVNATDFNDIDLWLKARLESFLGEALDNAKLKSIQNAVVRMRKKAEDFYTLGRSALTKKYTAEFHFAFQKTTTKTALLDFTFDFEADAASAKKFLGKALEGDFTDLILSKQSGVKMNKAVLTHEIKRHTHIDINLPYFSRTIDHINKSLASGKAVDEADGRLWVMTLNAFDLVAHNDRMSKLSIAMEFLTKNAIRKYDDKAFTKEEEERYSIEYALRVIKTGARRRFLKDNFEKVAGEFLPDEFGVNGKQDFGTYLTALDKSLDEISIDKNLGDKSVSGDDNFGDMLIGLDASLSGRVFSAWKNAPLNSDDKVYRQMSVRVQRLLRSWIPMIFINDPKKYKEIDVVYPLLVYASLPLVDEVGVDFNMPETFNKHRGRTLDNLKEKTLPLAIQDGADERYKVERAEQIIKLKSAGTLDEQRKRFNSLALCEIAIIKGIRNAGVKFAVFMEDKDPEKAIKHLAEFGSEITDAFNNKIGSTLFSGKQLRPLGITLFSQVSSILSGDANVIRPSAMLEFIVLNPKASFKTADYLSGTRPSQEEALLQQRIVNAGGGGGGGGGA